MVYSRQTDIVTRWWIFNAVGIAGLGLQLGCLWILKDGLGVHYVVAAVVAVELAILHNFWGHERWTWADRPTSDAARVRRLVWFNLSSAATSLLSIVVMMVLVEMLRLHYLVANVLGVGACSLVHFAVSDIAVFRKIDKAAILVAVWALAAPARAADLHGATVAAFDRYVQATELRMKRELGGSAPFLWIDRLPEAERRDQQTRLQQGQILVRRIETRDAGSAIDVPKGMCHHWVGTVFIPGATLGRVVSLMQGYERYQDVYRPAIRRSKTISRSGNHFRVSLKLFMKRVLSVVLNTEYDVEYIPVAGNRMHVRSYSTRIAEVAEPDSRDEQEKPVGHDSGFLWRFNNYCSIEARMEGAYVQCETVSLTRDIPIGLGWLVGPFVSSIPRDSLEFTLGAMRATLTKPS